MVPPFRPQATTLFGAVQERWQETYQQSIFIHTRMNIFDPVAQTGHSRQPTSDVHSK